VFFTGNKLDDVTAISTIIHLPHSSPLQPPHTQHVPLTILPPPLTRALGTAHLPLAILPHRTSPPFIPPTFPSAPQLTPAPPVHTLPMGHRLLPDGQNVHGIALQHPRQDRVGDDGGAGVYDALVYHVYAAGAKWD